MGSLLETRYYLVGQQRGLCAAAQLSSAQEVLRLHTTTSKKQNCLFDVQRVHAYERDLHTYLGQELVGVFGACRRAV
jgi:hypothetical protein